jgi:hypothetical protein|tara:strand:+ start:3637 stop:4644 length:1008 start_codon:yes stop_codon:yes gene_type:complete
MTKAIIGFKDKVLKQRGAVDTLEMLLYDAGDFKHYGELYDDAENFLVAAEEIYADGKIDPNEFEKLIHTFEKTRKMDLITSLLGSVAYSFNKEKFKKVGDIPSEGLAVITANLMRYFFMRMCEMADEAGLIDSATFYRAWKAKRGMKDMFGKGLDKEKVEPIKIKKAELGQRSERHTLSFFMSETRRGALVGGLNEKDCRTHIINMCKSFKTTSDVLDAVLDLGKKPFVTTVEGGKGGQKFDFTRFLVGLNSFIQHKKELKGIERPLQVFIGQLIYVIVSRFAFHFHVAEISAESPSHLDRRDVRMALEGFFDLTKDQIKGKNEELEVVTTSTKK